MEHNIENIIKRLLELDIIYDNNLSLQDIINIISNKKKVYFGIDPSSNSLHIGHVALLNVLLSFEKIGIGAIIVIGEGTTLLGGDPSEKFKERPTIPSEIIKNNTKSIIDLIKKFKKNTNANFRIVNNKTWLKEQRWLFIIKDVYKKISINNLLKQNFFKKRLVKDEHLGLNEIIYPIVQGFDFLYLFQKQECCIQIGGQDQVLNILSGINLIEKIEHKKSYFITFKLITDQNNKKIGKSESNKKTILFNSKTKSFQLWQYIRSLPDEISNILYKYVSIHQNKKINNINNIKEYNANLIISQFFSPIENEYIKFINENINNIENIYLKKIKKIEKIIPKIIIFKEDSIETLFKKTNIFSNNKEINFFLEKNLIKNKKVYLKDSVLYLFENEEQILLKISKKNVILFQINSNE